MKQSEKESMIKEMCRHNKKGYDMFYDAYVDMLYIDAASSSSKPEDVLPLLEAMIMEIWQNIPLFNPRFQSFEMWMLSITITVKAGYRKERALLVFEKTETQTFIISEIKILPSDTANDFHQNIG